MKDYIGVIRSAINEKCRKFQIIGSFETMKMGQKHIYNIRVPAGILCLLEYMKQEKEGWIENYRNLDGRIEILGISLLF